MKKVLRWLLFSVLFALIPIFLNAIALTNRGGIINYSSLEFLLGHGELYLVSVTLCAVALGELFGIESKSIYQVITGAASLVIIVIASFYYAQASLYDAYAYAKTQQVQIQKSEIQKSEVEKLSNSIDEEKEKEILTLDIRTIINSSLFLFICAVIVSTSCIAMTEEK